jgi:hydroxyacylglutathione hydrolase
MRVDRLPAGPWRENGYLVANRDEAILIDPGGNAVETLALLSAEGLRLQAIVNTHGHFDHIGAIHPITEQLNVPFYISGREWPIMKSSNMLRFIFKSKEKVVVPAAIVDLDELPGELELAGLRLRCFPTPGHTPGGYCFVIGDHIFSGDTVLSSMPGTSELPGGDAQALAESLEFLGTLEPGLILHPGHGRDRTLGEALSLIAARETQA